MAAAASGAAAGAAAAATAATCNPYTPPRVNHLRYTGAILIDGPAMYKSLFGALLPEETNRDWDDGQLWKSWCDENYEEAITNYRFFKGQKKKSDVISEKFIPILEKGDVTFFAHVVDKKVTRRHVRDASNHLRSKRNDIAHDDGTGIDDIECYERFEFLKKNVVEKMFQDFPGLKMQWLNHLERVRMGQLDAGRLEEVERRYSSLKEKVAKAQMDARELRKMLERSQLQTDKIIQGLEDEAPLPPLSDGTLNQAPEQSLLPLQPHPPASRGQPAISAPPDVNTDEPIFQESLELPLHSSLIFAPPILKSPSLDRLRYDDWSTAKRFFIGVGFVAAEVDGKILFWGGVQHNSGKHLFLPKNVVFVAEVDSHDLRWQRIQETGDIPSGIIYAAFAVIEKLIYLFGGDRGFYEPTNEIFSLSPSGEFKRLIPIGEVPSARFGHQGWSFEGKLYFLGGLGPKGEGGDWVEKTSKPGMFYNNQLIEFDPEINCFSHFPTNGRSPSPRSYFAVARLKEKVYIHGGSCEDNPLDDFHVLNMKSHSWSSLRFGLPAAIGFHTLSPVSASQLLLVGGGTPSGHSKEIFVFNVKDSSFQKIQNLPSEFCGDDEGLSHHRAIVVTKEKRATHLVCVGGCVERRYRHHPNYIISFDL